MKNESQKIKSLRALVASLIRKIDAYDPPINLGLEGTLALDALRDFADGKIKADEL